MVNLTKVLAHVHTGTYNAGPEAVAMMRLFCGVGAPWKPLGVPVAIEQC